MILVVEDTASMRKIVVAMLNKIGYKETLEAANGAEALEHLRMRHVDAIMTDWKMPEMDGSQFLQQIRATPAYAFLPVVVFTSNQDKVTQEAATIAGADFFLTKPFSIPEMKRGLATAMARRTQEQVKKIILGTDPMRSEHQHTLLVVGERAVTAQRLIRADEKDTLHFLSSLVSAVETINGEADEGPVLGYTLEADGSQIARRVRTLPGRARLALLSTNLPTAVTTARLLGVNRPSGLTIALACREKQEISGKMRTSLENMGAILLERHRLDADAITALLKEHGIHDPDAAASELPTPEQLQQRLEQDVKDTADLPVLAHVFQKITMLDEDPDSALQDWIDVIETDPLSSAQVIKRARSPAYGFQGEINQVDKAVILLGKDEVKQIVISGAVKRSLDKITEKGFSVDEYWVHSVAVAVTARLLSFPMDMGQWSPDDKKRFEDLALEDEIVTLLSDLGLWSRFELKTGEDPFVGGIMHDVGKVVLAHAYPGLFPAVIEELIDKNWQVPMSAVETDFTGGSDHSVIGGVLAADWDLGEATTAAVSQHHSHHPTNNLARLIAIADFVAGALYPFPANAKYPQVEAVAAMLKAESEEDMIKVPIPEGLAAWLPDAVTDSLKTGRSELLHLACKLAPTIRRLVGGVQNSV